MATDLKDKYLSKPLEARTSEYICFCKDCDRFNPATECDREIRLYRHSKDLSRLLLTCPEIVTLLVGPDEVELTGHKALLSFFSNFFDTAVYDALGGSNKSQTELPEDSPEVIAAFLTWIYSGLVESPTCAFELWILGDRLRSPMFSNEAMHLMFSTYGRHTRWIGARAADLAYNKTAPGSKLRAFVGDYVEVHGPLCKSALKGELEEGNETYERYWRVLVEGGGDLVVHIMMGNGIRGEHCGRFHGGSQPYRPEQQENYMLEEMYRDVEEFIMDHRVFGGQRSL